MEEFKKQKLKCLLIDADINELREFARVVMNNPDLELVNTCKTGRTASNILKETPIDLVIINPALPDANGFDLMASLPNPPIVVIISDRPDYAYYAFRIHAVDYRLKPITPDILKQIMDRVFNQLILKNALESAKKGNTSATP